MAEGLALRNRARGKSFSCGGDVECKGPLRRENHCGQEALCVGLFELHHSGREVLSMEIRLARCAGQN